VAATEYERKRRGFWRRSGCLWKRILVERKWDGVVPLIGAAA